MKSYIGVLILFLVFACNKEEKSTISASNSDSTLKTLSILHDSVQSSYSNLRKLDSVKFSNIKRLLEEISYCKVYDHKSVDELLAFNSKIYKMFIPIDSISDAKINEYDSLSILLVNKVRALKENTKEIINHPIAEELENQILETDTKLIIKYRSAYDYNVKNYNDFYNAHKEVILNSELKNIKSKFESFSYTSI